MFRKIRRIKDYDIIDINRILGKLMKLNAYDFAYIFNHVKDREVKINNLIDSSISGWDIIFNFSVGSTANNYQSPKIEWKSLVISSHDMKIRISSSRQLYIQDRLRTGYREIPIRPIVKHFNKICKTIFY